MKAHLLSAADLTHTDALLVLDTAEELARLADRPIKKLPTLRGRTVVNLFFEDSTRTRISFEAAAKRLSADVINFSAKGSSVSKGESLKDTLEPLAAKLITSADSRLAAASKEIRVRVESSKKRLTTVRPRSVGSFLIGRSASRASSSAVSSTRRASSWVRSAAESRWDFIGPPPGVRRRAGRARRPAGRTGRSVARPR